MSMADQRGTWLRAAALFAQMDAWMVSDSLELEELQRIVDELRELGIPQGWIGAALSDQAPADE